LAGLILLIQGYQACQGLGCGKGGCGLDKATILDHNNHTGRYDYGDTMVTEVSAVNFRQNLGEMLNQVQYRNDSIVISKDGKPVAALVDAELFARIRRMQDRFNALSGRIAEAYADVPVEEGVAEINALVAKERAR
jgi:prevent-host-death family protein